jgi:hypothetical protein
MGRGCAGRPAAFWNIGICWQKKEAGYMRRVPSDYALSKKNQSLCVGQTAKLYPVIQPSTGLINVAPVVDPHLRKVKTISTLGGSLLFGTENAWAPVKAPETVQITTTRNHVPPSRCLIFAKLMEFTEYRLTSHGKCNLGWGLLGTYPRTCYV